MILELSNIYLFPLLLATGFCAGTVDAIAGGGGLITLPVLLSLGVPPHLALGTNKLQSLFGTSMAAYRYYKNGLIETKKLTLGLLCSLAGAIIGAIATQQISSELLKNIIPILLFLILIYTLLSPHLGTKSTLPKLNEKWFYLTIGTLLGFYDGFFGPGAGSLWTFLLVFFLGYNLIRATACAKVFNLNSNVCSLVCFIIAGNVDYRIGLCMAVGQLFGGRFGAGLTIKNGAKLIRPVFITVVFITISSLVYKNLTAIDSSLPIAMQTNPTLAKNP